MDLEPGYVIHEPMPFAKRVSYDGLFEGLADQLTGPLGDSDGALASTSASVGDGVPTDLDHAYGTTVGTAAEAHNDQVRGGTQSVAGVLIGQGADVETLRGAVLRFLPQPDAPVSMSLIDPPDSNLIHQGRGFDTPKPAPTPGKNPPEPGGPPDQSEAVIRQRIRDMYLALLGREPDQSGWDGWTSFVIDGGHSLDEVRQGILDSAEYHQLHGG